MKRIITIILPLLLFLQLPTVAFAATQSDIIQRIDSDISIANNLVAEIEAVQEDPESIFTVLLRDIPSVVQHWRESSSFYEATIATETDEELKTNLININTEIKGLISSLELVEASINAEDGDAFDSAFAQYDSHMEALNMHIESLNNHYGGVDYSWLAWPFWAAVIISGILFLMSRGNPVLPAEQLRNQFEFALFKSSLWPLGGSAISYLWYLFTPPGGSFYVLYGPILVGYFQFFRGLFTYYTQVRPALNLAKMEEKSKLEALIRSDRFQKESMEEKVREIEKRTGVIDLTRDKSDSKDT
jgi:hypothetical protein